MANKIILKKSSVAAKLPLSTDLDVGELAVNLVDQKLYSKKADGTVVLVGTGISGGTGDVTGAVSSTDNAVTRFDGTTGKIIQNSAVIIDDTNNVSGVATLNASNLVIADNSTLGSSNTDTVAVNARITTDLDPNTSGARDIGTSGRNWRDGFFSRNVTVGTITGGVWNGTTIAVANGGTGSTSLTANNVLLGNGTSAPLTVAPSTSGNVLTSNGTTWVSSAALAGAAATPTALGTVFARTQSATPFNTSVGYQAGNATTGVNNTFLGYQSGISNTSGTDNIAIGYQSFFSETNGTDNIAIGRNALFENSVATVENVVIGNYALDAVTGVNASNVAIGYQAMTAATAATSVVAVGSFALRFSTTGTENAAVGTLALKDLTTGSNNVAIGYQAGLSLTTGTNNILIGTNAQATSATVSNETTIGRSSTTSARIFGDLKFLNSYTELVFAVTGTTPALSPANGSIQTWTLSANSTPTAGTWNAGQSITFMIDDGSAFTINWATVAVTWKTGGGTAPTLNTTGFTAITLWKVGAVVYGARVGDA